jgi:hypothetical protein
MVRDEKQIKEVQRSHQVQTQTGPAFVDFRDLGESIRSAISAMNRLSGLYQEVQSRTRLGNEPPMALT